MLLRAIVMLRKVAMVMMLVMVIVIVMLGKMVIVVVVMVFIFMIWRLPSTHAIEKAENEENKNQQNC